MKACPANALWAMKHGEYAGRNIALAIKNKPLKIFSYKGIFDLTDNAVYSKMGNNFTAERQKATPNKRMEVIRIFFTALKKLIFCWITEYKKKKNFKKKKKEQ